MTIRGNILCQNNSGNQKVMHNSQYNSPDRVFNLFIQLWQLLPVPLASQASDLAGIILAVQKKTGISEWCSAVEGNDGGKVRDCGPTSMRERESEIPE